MARAGITRIADVTGLDTPGIPTVMVVRPNGRSLSVTQGKGLTLESAKASGVMEAIEHDHAETPDLPLVLRRVGQMGSASCDLSGLPPFPRLHGPVTNDTRLLWTEAEELGSGAARWVPFEMVHLDLTLPLPESSGHFPIGSSGLASGNTLLEATVHALTELIERDARTLFFLSPEDARRARRVNLESITDTDCVDLVKRFAGAGLTVAVWDISTDLAVASFLVGVLEKEDNVFRRVPLAYGSGTHLDRGIALIRALTEAAQTRLTNITGSRDDTLPQFLDAARSDSRQARYRSSLTESRPLSRSFEAAPHTHHDSFAEDLDFLREALDRRGLGEVLRVDLSREGWPVRVVRLIVPGLEGHIDMPGYLPGSRAQEAGIS